MDTQELIERCKAGEGQALGLLYTRYAPRMRRMVRRYTEDEVVAEDIVHDGFIIIFSSISSLNDTAKLESWMATLMRRLALRQIGRRGADIVPIEAVAESERMAADPAPILSDYETLLRLIETLPDGYRSVFRLAVFEEMSHKEIGALLGINAHSSSSQLARAKTMLRRMLTDYGYVPAIALALLYSMRLDMPKIIVQTRRLSQEAEERIIAEELKEEIIRAIRKDSIARIDQIDTAFIAKEDTFKEEPACPAGRQKPVQPTTPDVHLADDTPLPTTKKQEKSQWLASVSYSGANGANSSALIERQPSAGSDITDEKEMVEQRTHHYPPFVLTLSLQKRLDDRWSIGTGLRYTRLKTDITTISPYETTFKTQTVHYIGVPLSATYRLWRTGQLSLYTSAGIAADIPVSGSRKWQWSVNAAAGFSYQLTPSVSLFAEPTLNYYINSTHGTPTIWTDRPFTLTIPLGLRFEW